jgi:uncharacterized LabA/DUF88 family protein
VPRVAAYIDGFNLYYGMKSRFGRRYMWLDVVEMIRQLRPSDDVGVVRYFTAIVRDEPLAAANQTTYLRALKARNGAHLDIHVGRFKQRTIGRCKVCRQDYLCACPTTYVSYEEKETDVALGVAMVEDAARGIGEMTVLVSADSDLIPAIEATKRIDATRPIYLAMPPSRARGASRFQGIGIFGVSKPALRAAQMPDVVTDPATGLSYVRPAKWS